MSKKAWSPGRMIRSLNTCGCGLQRSPDTALMLSTCSDPRSNRNFVTSATRSLSRTPGLRRSDSIWYAPSTIEQAVLSSMISSIDLTSRASSMTCWASTTVIPSASSAATIGGSTMSTPSGMSSTPSAFRISQISRAARRNRPASGRHGAAQADHPGVDVVLGQPRAVQAMVLGRRPEVPDVRAAAARLERVARHLVAGPLADVRARDVADVVEVEQQHRAKVGGVERGPGAAEAVRPEAVGVDPLLPVDGHRSRRRERPHPDPSLQARRDTGAIAPFTNATQRWSGRNPTATLDR